MIWKNKPEWCRLMLKGSDWKHDNHTCASCVFRILKKCFHKWFHKWFKMCTRLIPKVCRNRAQNTKGSLNPFFSFFFFEAHYINISPEINMYQRQAKSCKSFSRLKLKILNYVGGREQILIEILLVGIYLKLDPFRWRGVEDCQVNDFVSEIENWCPSEVFSWGKIYRVENSLKYWNFACELIKTGSHFITIKKLEPRQHFQTFQIYRFN